MDEANSSNIAGTDVPFEIRRTFDAPRELVFKTWTEAEHLKRWWGPKNFTMMTCRIDARPNGTFLYGMRAQNGMEMWGKWVFREIVPPERMVFISTFSDAQGGVTRNPWAPVWPLETLSTVTMAEQDNKTTVSMQGIPINASEAEHKAFQTARGGMSQGWTGVLDQLAAYLGEIK
jgi:uncharacterized protein YndB with AHSA1/START domain